MELGEDDCIPEEIDISLEADANDMEFYADNRTTKCNSAGTILNICAILSKIGKHK